jgi:RNA polymerase sigma factor (sigma-70 family)
LTEQDLISGCIDENRQCQHLLFQQYAGKFMAICLRYANSESEAEDMVQEGFMIIFNKIKTFKNLGPLGAWMRRIIINVALKEVNKKKIHFVDVTNETVPFSQPLESEIYSQMGENDILKLVNSLPQGYKIVFTLFVIEGFSHEEISELIDIQPATSRSQLVKARKMLQEKIIALQKIAV